MDLRIRLYLRFLVQSLNNYKLNFKFNMKKIVLTAIVAVAAVGSVIGVRNQSAKADLPQLTMANIEALTAGETGSGVVYDKCCIHDLNEICVPDSGPIHHFSAPC